jgi:hypothetical protein
LLSLDPRDLPWIYSTMSKINSETQDTCFLIVTG